MDRVVNGVVSLVAHRRPWRRCCRSAIVLYHSLAPAPPVTAWTTPNTQSLRLLHAQPLRHSPEVNSRPHSVANNTDIDQNLSVGDRILKTIGWMAGFYSRKAVSSKALYYGTCISNIVSNTHIHIYIAICFFLSCSFVFPFIFPSMAHQVLSRSALQIYRTSIDEIDYEAFFKGGIYIVL